MKTSLKKWGLATLSVIGLSTIAIPTTIGLVSCTSASSLSDFDSLQAWTTTQPTTPLTQSDIVALQNKANEITTVNDALDLINKTLTKHYSFEMFKKDLINAINFKYQYYGVIYKENNIPIKAGTVWVNSDITNITLNPDQQTVDFDWEYKTHTDYMGDAYINSHFTKVPFKPILVNETRLGKTTTTFKMAFALGSGSIRWCNEPKGDVCKSFATKIIENSEFDFDPEHIPEVQTQWNDHPLGYIGNVGTTTFWNQYNPASFNQSIIYNYDADKVNQNIVKLANIDSVSNCQSNSSELKATCFNSSIQINFPKLS